MTTSWVAPSVATPSGLDSTIRRGARVGAGAVICPGIEIGEDAFVGAGAVVTKDVPPRTVVVGNPARYLRDVPEAELLEQG